MQTKIDALNGWQMETRIEQVLTKLCYRRIPRWPSFPAVGYDAWHWRVRWWLIRMCSPLDEPTNHLDIDMVRWLEEQIKDFKGAVLFISHDRAFIRHLATRIIDLDRGQLHSYPGDYDRYLQKKQELLEVEAAQNAEFDKKLAAEEVWIRPGH